VSVAESLQRIPFARFILALTLIIKTIQQGARGIDFFSFWGCGRGFY
jgi:hypothetical protein